MTHQSTNEYIFNSDWFTHNIPSLKAVFEYVKPQRILEIGSFEGRSTIFFMEEALKYQPQVEIHCIDSWEGGAEQSIKVFGIWERLSSVLSIILSLPYGNFKMLNCTSIAVIPIKR